MRGRGSFHQVLSFHCQKISHKQTHPSKGSYCRLAHCRKEGGHEASLIRQLWDQLQIPQPTHFSPSAAAAAEPKACGSGGSPACSRHRAWTPGCGAASTQASSGPKRVSQPPSPRTKLCHHPPGSAALEATEREAPAP